MTELSTASRKLQTVFDAVVHKRGLTLARTRVLLHLSNNPGVNQKELANILGVETPTVVRLLDGMEKHGQIARKAADRDRRAKQIVLTAFAERQVEEIEEISHRMGRQILEGVNGSDLQVTLRVLRQVVSNLEKSCSESTLP